MDNEEPGIYYNSDGEPVIISHNNFYIILTADEIKKTKNCGLRYTMLNKIYHYIDIYETKNFKTVDKDRVRKYTFALEKYYFNMSKKKSDSIYENKSSYTNVLVIYPLLLVKLFTSFEINDTFLNNIYSNPEILDYDNIDIKIITDNNKATYDEIERRNVNIKIKSKNNKLHRCRKCKSGDTLPTRLYNRSADESTATSVVCRKCGHSWVC